MFKKTIFSHMMYINMITVIIGTIFLTVLQSFLLTQYVENSSALKLSEDAKAIVRMVNKEGTLNSDYIRSYLEGFSESSDYNIFVVDETGRIAIEIATGEEFNKSTTKIDKSYLRGSEYTLRGTLDGAFREEMDIYVAPIIETDEAGNSFALGEIIISTPRPAQWILNNQIIKIATYSTLIVLILAFMFAYYSSGRIVRPIKIIGDNAKKFAKGEFESRVELTKADSRVKELGELAQTFNNMAGELEKFEEVRNNFVSDVSHELRTPMTTITGFVEGILDGTVPPEKEKEYLKIVYDECKRLSRLVNSFLEVTRNLNQKIELEITDFDINRLITRTALGFEKIIDEKNIKVDIELCSDFCSVRADKDAIKRVLTNLFDNAVKFTPQGGNIKISVAEEAKDVEISVRNTGKGISKEEARLIFERFYKEDKSRSENKNGTGIGLYIVKSIINRHGKNITASGVEGEYAEFKFSLEKGRL
ncbi:MAG: HAMP domain-containing histidine kinase [Clostridia bacterium]|nr:HAMP domain-containing histidine kinase [Clostridia bacterium]